MDDRSLFKEKQVFIHSSSFARRVLRANLLMAPEGGKYTKRHILRYALVNFIFVLPLLFGVVGFITKGILDNVQTGFVDSIKYIGYFHFYLAVSIVWLYRCEAIEEFLVENETYHFGVPKTLKSRKKFFSFWRVITLVFFNAMAIGGLIINHIIYCQEEYDEEILLCELGFPVWFPFNIHNLIIKIYIIISKWIMVIFLANSMMIYQLVLENLIFLAARIRYLKHLLTFVRFKENIDLEYEKLYFCIRYHWEIKRLVRSLKNTMGFLILPHFIFVGFMLSLSEYGVLFESDYSALVDFVTWVLGPVFFCECGYSLNNEYDQLRWAVYDINWYEIPGNLRKNYMIFLGSVQEPIHLIAPPIFCLDRIFCMTIFRGSFSLLMYWSKFGVEN